MHAHPDKDGLEDVTKEDAKELIGFLEQYLNYVYVRAQFKKVSSLEGKKSVSTLLLQK